MPLGREQLKLLQLAQFVSWVLQLGLSGPEGLGWGDRAVVIGAVPLVDMLSLHAEVKLTVFLCCVLIAHLSSFSILWDNLPVST